MRIKEELHPEVAPTRLYATPFGEVVLRLTGGLGAGETPCGRLSVVAPVNFGEGPYWTIENGKWWLAPSGAPSVEKTVAWPIFTELDPYAPPARGPARDLWARNQRIFRKALAAIVPDFLADAEVIAEYRVALDRQRRERADLLVDLETE
jgi:hypothetical protein